MFLAHLKLSYFRGLTNLKKEIQEQKVVFQLLECLVRALLDFHEPKRGLYLIKFYLEVSQCNLELKNSLELKIWQTFLATDLSLLNDNYNNAYNVSFLILKTFFERVCNDF